MKKVGILGAGQLAQMLAQAGRGLKQEFTFLSPEESPCAAPFGKHLKAEFDDNSAADNLSQWADVITTEFENVSLALVKRLETSSLVHPSSKSLAICKDRVLEKKCFNNLGIATARYKQIDSLKELQMAMSEIQYPAILKTRSEGYDGKGQVVLSSEQDLEAAWERLLGVQCIVESMVSFDRELSIICARSQNGETAVYPLNENHHREGILRLSLNLESDLLQSKAEAMIKQFMEMQNYVGVLSIELFQIGDQLLANEMAPRVHNSGHGTIEGSRASQFENHLRAITGLPLGEARFQCKTAMINLIGKVPSLTEIQNAPGVAIHLYGKEERPGRKIGHLTVTNEGITESEFTRRFVQLLEISGEIELANRWKVAG